MRDFEFLDTLPDDKEIAHYNSIVASVESFETLMDKLTKQYIQSVSDSLNVKASQDDNEEQAGLPNKFNNLLPVIYKLLIKYRGVINNNSDERINEISSKLQSSLNDMVNLCEGSTYDGGVRK